jgi:hypothetical protein
VGQVIFLSRVRLDPKHCRGTKTPWRSEQVNWAAGTGIVVEDDFVGWLSLAHS